MLWLWRSLSTWCVSMGWNNFFKAKVKSQNPKFAHFFMIFCEGRGFVDYQWVSPFSLLIYCSLLAHFFSLFAHFIYTLCFAVLQTAVNPYQLMLQTNTDSKRLGGF